MVHSFSSNKILFEDPEHDDFVILEAGNDFIKAFYEQQVIIGHRCKTFKVAQFLSSEDAMQGQCWWCKANIPESIITIWKLHNFDNLPRLITQHHKYRDGMFLKEPIVFP